MKNQNKEIYYITKNNYIVNYGKAQKPSWFGLISRIKTVKNYTEVYK